MKDVEIRAMSAVTDKFTPEELKTLKDYYGAPPALLEGFRYIKNSESSDFLARVTDGPKDLSKQ